MELAQLWGRSVERKGTKGKIHSHSGSEGGVLIFSGKRRQFLLGSFLDTGVPRVQKTQHKKSQAHTSPHACAGKSQGGGGSKISKSGERNSEGSYQFESEGGGDTCVRSGRHKPLAPWVLLAPRYTHQGPWEGSASSETGEAEDYNVRS